MSDKRRLREIIDQGRTGYRSTRYPGDLGAVAHDASTPNAEQHTPQPVQPKRARRPGKLVAVILATAAAFLVSFLVLREYRSGQPQTHPSNELVKTPTSPAEARDDRSPERVPDQGRSDQGRSDQGRSDQGRSDQGRSDQGRSDQAVAKPRRTCVKLPDFEYTRILTTSNKVGTRPDSQPQNVKAAVGKGPSFTSLFLIQDARQPQGPEHVVAAAGPRRKVLPKPTSPRTELKSARSIRSRALWGRAQAAAGQNDNMNQRDKIDFKPLISFRRYSDAT